jgi:hypothetical protein
LRTLRPPRSSKVGRSAAVRLVTVAEPNLLNLPRGVHVPRKARSRRPPLHPLRGGDCRAAVQLVRRALRSAAGSWLGYGASREPASSEEVLEHDRDPAAGRRAKNATIALPTTRPASRHASTLPSPRRSFG